MRAVFAAIRRSFTECCDRFYVAEPRRAQGQPLGLEDGNDVLPPGLVDDAF